MNLKNDYQENIEIRFLNEDFLKDIKRTAMNTVGKRNIESKTISPELLRKYMISEHSPIRAATLEALFIGVYYPTSVHFARHVHSVPFVTTSREDRTGKERSLDTPVDHLSLWNLQSLIDMMRKRLCQGSCSKDTFSWAKSLKLKMFNSNDEHIKVIGECLVPNCIYRFGCPEFYKCNINKKLFESLLFDDIYDIGKRYKKFNEYFF